MSEQDDHELLAEFARHESEAAFVALVGRYVNLVYSTALRFTANPDHAQEITQAVFIILARKADRLRRETVLSGWLYQAARLTAANFVKVEIRRQHREQEAYMQSTVNEPDAGAWEQLAPWLDEAMGNLGETDRNAIVLRFFENKTAAEVGAALKMSEAAAHKRVSRALEKLRRFFTRRGVALSAPLIAAAVTTNSVQAAPTALAKTISAIAATKSAVAGGSTLTLVKGALKLMAWTKAKTALAAGVAAILVIGTATLITKQFQDRQPFQLVSQWPGNGNADDPVGGNNGKLMNGATFAPGKVGEALSFNGAGAHVRVPDATNLHFAGAITLQAWVYPTRLADGVSHAILDKWDAVTGFDQRSYGWGFHEDGRLSWGGSSDGVNLTGDVYAKATVPAKAWTFLTATYDGTTLKLYVNGALDNSAAYSGGFIAGTNDMGIGGEVGGAPAGVVNGPFAGLIDALAVYNRALPAAEIEADYKAGMAGKSGPASLSRN